MRTGIRFKVLLVMYENDKREEASDIAEQRYSMDYKGILLNTGVSALSSVTATGVLNFFQTVPASQLPVVVAVLFVAQVLPKLLVELNKSYVRNKAKQKAFRAGLLENRFESGNKDKGMVETFFSFCDHASYF